MNTTDTTNTKETVAAAITIVLELAKAITAAGERGIPNGHLYAQVMHVLSFDTYTKAITLLKNSGIITEQFHVLRATKLDK